MASRVMKPVRILVSEFEDACNKTRADVELSIRGAVQVDKSGRLSLAGSLDSDLSSFMPSANTSVAAGILRAKNSDICLTFSLTMRRAGSPAGGG